MKTVIWLAVLCGLTVAVPSLERKRRGISVSSQEEPPKPPGRSPLEKLAEKHHPLSVLVFKRTMFHLLDRVEFMEKRLKAYATKADDLFQNFDTNNLTAFHGLGGDWEKLKRDVLSGFLNVGGNLALINTALYFGHVVDFDESDKCSNFKKAFAEPVDREASLEDQVKKVVGVVRKESQCFIDFLASIITPLKEFGSNETQEIDEKEAMGVTVRLVKGLFFLKLNGERFFHAVRHRVMEIKQGQGQGQPYGQGQAITEDKRILELLRRYMAVKRGPEGPQHGGSSQQQSGGSNQGPHQGGNAGPAGGREGAGAGSGSSQYEDDSKEPEIDLRPAPFPRRAFFDLIKWAVGQLKGIKDKMERATEALEKDGLTNQEREEALQKIGGMMEESHGTLNKATGVLGYVIIRLYINNDTEITPVNKCGPLKISQFQETIDDPSEAAAFVSKLRAVFVEDAKCFEKLVSNDEELRLELKNTCNGLTENRAFDLTQGLFLHLHTASRTTFRLIYHAERASKPLVDYIRQQAVAAAQTQGRRELRMLERELADVIQKRLNNHA